MATLVVNTYNTSTYHESQQLKFVTSFTIDKTFGIAALCEYVPVLGP